MKMKLVLLVAYEQALLFRWTSETSLARTRERAAKPRGAEERIGSHAGVFRGARISSLRTTLLKSPAFP